MDSLVITLLDLVNETLASAIVVIAASLLLYNLTRNLNDRVARTSGILLACVTAAYISDVFISLGPSPEVVAVTLRLQWIGIAFMPAALFHLSDALLATTGRFSRGRRRRVVRLLYLISAAFLILAAFTNLLIETVPITSAPLVSVRGRALFPVYIAFFLVAAAVSFINVQRARQRCLTRSTRRRMGYLQVAMLTPAIGIFPFSLLLPPGQEYALVGLLLVNLANGVVILMLLFLAYPLSFFGSRVPDRVVKVELLRFLMRGPATGLLALATIIFVTPTASILGLPGQDFMPFAVVAVVLLWQWATALSLPLLEKRLVYQNEDYDRLSRLQDLSERLLTRSDLVQLLEAILAAACDYLRVNSAFVATLNHDSADIAAAIGPLRPSDELLTGEIGTLHALLETDGDGDFTIESWHTSWIVPLHHARQQADGAAPPRIGLLGIQARSAQIDLSADERVMLRKLARRAAQTLDDMHLHDEIYAALEGLLPQINLTRSRAADVEYRRVNVLPAPPEPTLPDREQMIEQVKAALNHYWGGPGLTNSRLLDLGIVRKALPENDDSPARALRAVLLKAIERQRPEGERRLNSPEWVIFNILELRFVKGLKAREVADRIFMAEPTLYRKQRIAVEAVADTLIDLEREYVTSQQAASKPSIVEQN